MIPPLAGVMAVPPVPLLASQVDRILPQFQNLIGVAALAGTYGVQTVGSEGHVCIGLISPSHTLNVLLDAQVGLQERSPGSYTSTSTVLPAYVEGSAKIGIWK